MAETSIDYGRKSKREITALNPNPRPSSSDFSVNGVFEHLGIGPSCGSFDKAEESQLTFLQIRLASNQCNSGRVVSGLVMLDSRVTPKTVNLELRGQYSVKTVKIDEKQENGFLKNQIKRQSTFKRNPFHSKCFLQDSLIMDHSRNRNNCISSTSRRFSGRGGLSFIHQDLSSNTTPKNIKRRTEIYSFNREFEVIRRIRKGENNVGSGDEGSGSSPANKNLNSNILPSFECEEEEEDKEENKSQSSNSNSETSHHFDMLAIPEKKATELLIMNKLPSINQAISPANSLKTPTKSQVLASTGQNIVISDSSLDFDYNDEDFDDTDDGPLNRDSLKGESETKAHKIKEQCQRKKFMSPAMKIYNMPMGWNVFLVKNWKIFEFCKAVHHSSTPVLVLPFAIKLPEGIPPSTRVSIPERDMIHTLELTYEIHAVGFYPKLLINTERGTSVERSWEHLTIESPQTTPKMMYQTYSEVIRKDTGVLCCGSSKTCQVIGQISKNVLLKGDEFSNISLLLLTEKEIFENNSGLLCTVSLVEKIEWKSVSIRQNREMWSETSLVGRELSFTIESGDFSGCLQSIHTPDLVVTHDLVVRLGNAIESKEILNFKIFIESVRTFPSLLKPTSSVFTTPANRDWVQMPFSRLA